MSKKPRNRKLAAVIPATEVEIEIRVVIREIHTRTTTICDKRVETHIFDFGHDFEAAREWLDSDQSWMDMGDLCAEVCQQLTAKSEASR